MTKLSSSDGSGTLQALQKDEAGEETLGTKYERGLSCPLGWNRSGHGSESRPPAAYAPIKGALGYQGAVATLSKIVVCYVFNFINIQSSFDYHLFLRAASRSSSNLQN